MSSQEAIYQTSSSEINKNVTSSSSNQNFQVFAKPYNGASSSTSKSANGVENNVNSSEISDKEDIFLSVVYKNGYLGAAYLNSVDSELYVVEDTVDLHPEFSVMRSLYSRIKPAFTIVVGYIANQFVRTIIQFAQGNSVDYLSTLDSPKNIPANVKLLKPSEYTIEASLHSVKQLSLPGEPRNASDEERYLYLNTLINFKRKTSCYALGVLLMFLNKHWGMLQQDPSEGPKYLNINTYSIQNIMAVDQDTFQALQIFNTVAHPADFKKGKLQDNKERLSIYKLFNRCRSSLGRVNLRTLLLQPINNKDILRKRQDFIEFCLKPINNEVIRTISDSLKKIFNLTRVFSKINGNTASLNDWKKLQSTLENVLLINQVCGSYSEKVELFRDLSESISDDLYFIYQSIMQTINFEGGVYQINIKYGVDDELDKMKRYKEELKSKISLAASYELSNLPEYIKDCLILFIPEVGYVLSVSLSDQMDFQELNAQFGLKHYFTLGENVHFKSPVCEELDKTLGDVYKDINAIESRVLLRLTFEIISRRSSLKKPISIIALFDSLLCFSEVARELSYVKPEFTEENIIQIEDGRHPLLEIVLNNYVPNNFSSGGTNSCLKILTGPNASGKTIYAKQMATIVYLAHIGSFVPAKSATIGYMTGIYTRIRSTNSQTNEISAFAQSLRDMSYALMCADKNSVVLIDEFGKGTVELDGLALLTTFLKSFLRREECCPHIIVSTHYLSLTNLLPESPMVEHLKPDFRHYSDNLIFLYKIVKGVSSSYAFEAALCGGISPHIIKRSKEEFKKYQQISMFDEATTSTST